MRARVATAHCTARMHSARLYYCDAFTEMLMRGLYCIYYYTILTVSGGAARWMVVMAAAAAATAALLVSPHFAARRPFTLEVSSAALRPFLLRPFMNKASRSLPFLNTNSLNQSLKSLNQNLSLILLFGINEIYFIFYKVSVQI